MVRYTRGRLYFENDGVGALLLRYMKTNWEEVFRGGSVGRSARDHVVAVLVAGLIYGNPPVGVPLDSDPVYLTAALKNALRGRKKPVRWAIPNVLLECSVTPHVPVEARVQAC